MILLNKNVKRVSCFSYREIHVVSTPEPQGLWTFSKYYCGLLFLHFCKPGKRGYISWIFRTEARMKQILVCPKVLSEEFEFIRKICLLNHNKHHKLLLCFNFPCLKKIHYLNITNSMSHQLNQGSFFVLSNISPQSGHWNECFPYV